MKNTNINKAIALTAVIIIALTSSLANIFNTTFAAQVGTGSVNGTTTFDSAVMWNDSFPGTATGTITNVIVTAAVDPVLNMRLSTGAIALGTLKSTVYNTGSLDIEVGTNSISGVNISARSQSGGLMNVLDNAFILNDDLGTTTDGIPESYKFTSALNAIADSTVTGFTSSATLSTEVNNATTEHPVYSSNKPERTSLLTDDITFSVSAKIDEQTTAGNYQDKITFTVVGSF